MTANPELSRDSQGIIYRDSKTGKLFWDTAPTGPGAEKILEERTKQGLVPIASGSRSDILKIVEADQNATKARDPNITGRLTD